MKIKPQFLQNISIKDQLLCTQITTWVKKTAKTYELHSGYNNYADFTFYLQKSLSAIYLLSH